MAELSVRRILLLVISLAKCLEGTKLLAHLKKCGDLECETLISRVLAMRDYTGPDCRYLNFTEGEEISVYVKLAAEREDLWAGSKGKDFGFFPRDAVQIEEIFISEEVEIPTKESDFLCLFEEGYIFGSEDSELIGDNSGNMYPNEEDENQKYDRHESDFQIESYFYTTPESTLFEDKFTTSEVPEDVWSTGESKDQEAVEQDHTLEVDHVLPSLSVPEVQGWFGLGKEEAKDKASESVTEPVQESSFQSRKLAMQDEKELEKLSNGEPHKEYKKDPELEFDSESLDFSAVPDGQSELVSTDWLGSGFTSYLGFGEDDTGLESLSKENDLPLQDVSNTLSSDEKLPVPRAEILTETENRIFNDTSILSPNWFNFGFNMLGFAYANEDKIISDNEKNEKDGETDNLRHPTASEFDPEIELEREMLKSIGTEDQAHKERVLDNTDDSDTMPYFKKFFNFDNPWSLQNTPEETELPSFQQMLDQNKVFENDETEKLSAENYATDKDLMMLESKHSQSDTESEMELSMGIHEGIHFKTSSSKSNDENSKSIGDSEWPAPTENALLNGHLVLKTEDAPEFPILNYLLQIDIYGFVNSIFSPVVILLERVVAALPEDMKPQVDPSSICWELVACVFILGLSTILFLWKIFRSIQSRLYVGREKKLALELAGQIEEKCRLLEKLSLAQKEYEGLESSLQDANLEEDSTEIQSLECVEGSQISEVTCEDLERSKSKLDDEILFLEKELQEERTKHSIQDESMADISEKMQSLEDESKTLKAQVAEAKTTFKIFQINEERLKRATSDARSENSQLQESQKQLLQEVEVMKEEVSELNKQKTALEESKAHAEQCLHEKENQVKFLTERLLKMKDWAAVLGEDFFDNDDLNLEVKSESESGAYLESPPDGVLKKLIYAAKLNASLKALEGERNQIYTQLSEVDKAKEDLTERVESLQSKQASLQSEKVQLESEKQKLQQKLNVMSEVYQENEMKLHRKLTVEENYRLEKEEKLSKVDEKISHAAEEMETYRKRAKDLEEELERTINSYQGQIISHEKKAHDNWLAARTFERTLNDLRKENAYNRQKITETELKLELLEKDPYAFDVPNTALAREHSPYGPSPLGRPSSETRAFLSPPTLLEGPLRLSPLLPGGGGRGSRVPENPLDHQISNERGQSSYERLTDAQRAPSDTGSLSPPWEQDPRMMIPPPGQPYSDPALSLQRQDRFYPNSGRLSGPAELRSFNMPSVDKVDGPVSSEVESSRNDTKDGFINSNVPVSPGRDEHEAAAGGFVPSSCPPFRGPLSPVDPRSPFMRRGLPFLPPPGNMYRPPRDYFPPRDFSGIPPPPFPMRNVYAPRDLPPYLPPRTGFFPPPPQSENRNEISSESVPPPNKPATEPAEPQET